MKGSAFPHYCERDIGEGPSRFTLSLYNDNPDFPTVVFLPGTMVHPLFYDKFLCNIAAEHINVVGIHFTGHGKSPERKEPFVFRDLVQNTKEAIVFAKERYHHELIVFGSSQGSMVATAAVAGVDGIKALFLHDLMLPELPETIKIASLPWWLSPFEPIVPWLLKLLAKVFPSYPVRLTQYLDPERVAQSKDVIEKYEQDPLCRKAYPLSFIASLFNLDLACATDGSLHMPLVMITTKNDPLFPQVYMDKVFDMMVVPDKEMITFDLPCHTLLIDVPDDVSKRLVDALKQRFS